MQITCYRHIEAARESRFLPAKTYNLAHALLARSMAECLFVPIRNMQYLAIIDAEEWVFLDGPHKCWIDIAWQNFHPQVRTSLEEPVPYQAIYYQPEAMRLMTRLQAELPHALQNLAAKGRFDGPASVIKFPVSERR